ncbi:energy transducer TonB [Psychrobacter sp. AOP22-C1-22]|uniref:energy transducer TonB n=1 Tax=unclassified Psychrobacter TaxID=196806 RepID=UPI0017887A89|nr:MULTISPECIES: energy transducer TonB [unclassified Psychrobacter]MBE0408025.1 energy transducer TonB [Psychrobacter sp. FME6]MBE0444475.1 energy transducer TonB [Psychrobacter sp. FME5]MDN5802310.1 TonB family protein [Psychrobacter sp.]MDN5897133.1 TonB family protein [Psychrobacter sp.]
MAYIKDSQSYHFSAQAPKRNFSLPVAVVIAVAVHVLIIFGISFSIGKDPASMVQDVAKALTDNMQPNEDAQFIANASQQGGGTIEEQLRQENDQISSLPAEQISETQDVINLQRQVRQQRYQESYLRTTLSWRQASVESDNDSKQAQDDTMSQEERLRKQIATLEAQLSQRQQVYATKSKVVTVDSNSTTRGAADYINTFREHIERVGNLHFPAQARAQKINGEVRLMVIISSDGSIKAIRLLESSNSTILDEAAKQSVRQAAPFGKFTKDMGDIVELRLIRTFLYSDKVTVTY